MSNDGQNTQEKTESKLDPKKQEYITVLEAEKEEVTGSYPNCVRLLADEIDRVQNGRELNKLVEVHQPKPTKLTVKVLIPVKQFPKYNFVGKLLGPKGNSLKRLQDDTGCKMAILGRGSMRDQKKEDECRKEGGKYSHLNEDLHVLVEVFGLPGENHSRMAHAMNELQRFLTPDDNDDIRQQQFEEMMFLNGEQPGAGRGGPGGPPRGRGRGRGSAPPPPRGGGRGGGGGGAGPLLATPAGRSMPPPSASRGAPRGGGRGAPAGRAPPPVSRPAPVPRPPAPRPPANTREPAYEQDYYGSTQQTTSYAEDTYGYEEPAKDYQDPYGQQSYSQQSHSQETEYYDYGHGSSADDNYSESWGHSNSAYGKTPAPRNERAAPPRSHPYGSSGNGQRVPRY